MNPVDNRYSQYQIAVIETCGEVLASEQDWNDTEYLEEAWFSKHPEGFPMKAAFGLLFMNNVPGESLVKKTVSAGVLLKMFIEARLRRFLWQPRDFIVLSEEESSRIKSSDWPGPGEKLPRMPGNEEAADSIDGMTSAVARSSVKKPIITYRALATEREAGSGVLNSMKPGRVLTDKGFLSTTVNKNNLKWLGGITLVPIYMPPGVPALFLPSVEPLFKEELELVLQRGTNLKILDPRQVNADKNHVPVVVLTGE